MGRFVFLFTSMQARSFSPTIEFTGLSIEAKCEPMKKYKRACEKRMSKPVKSTYGVGRYCDMAVSPTRSHLLCIDINAIGVNLTQEKFSPFANCKCNETMVYVLMKLICTKEDFD